MDPMSAESCPRIAILNESHHVYLVQDPSGSILVEKVLSVFNIHVYQYLKDHPLTGIPRIVDCFQREDRLIVREEYILGTSLDQLIQSRSLTLSGTLSIMHALAGIVALLHSQDPPIIHRDIKPSHVLIDGHGQVWLLDLNAAKSYDPSESIDTVLLGTKGYAAPEQYGFGSSTPLTDIYAMGVLLNEMNDSLPRPDPAVKEIADIAVRLDPQNRFRSASAFQKALENAAKRFSAPTPSQNAGNRIVTAPSPVRPVKRSEDLKRFLPPGFRAAKPWKMALSAVLYPLLFWMIGSLRFEQYAVPCYIFLITSALFIIASAFNYLNVRRLMPLCKSRRKGLRILGLILMDLIFMMADLAACALLLVFAQPAG